MASFSKATTEEVVKATTQKATYRKSPKVSQNELRIREFEERWNRIPAATRKSSSYIEQVAFIAATVVSDDAKITKLPPVEKAPKPHLASPLMTGDYWAVSTKDHTYFLDVISRKDGAIKGVIVDGYGRTQTRNPDGNLVEFDRAEIVSAVPLVKRPGYGVLQYA